MEIEKKRSLALLILIVGVIALALIYALWGNFLNRGKIVIEGNAPFEVRIFEGETFQCAVTPCEIVQKRGPKTLIIAKEGFKSFLSEVKVPLWRTVKILAEMEREPSLEKVADDLKRPEPKNYQLKYDDNLQMQKLVSANNPEKALIYLPKSITIAGILGVENDKNVLLIDKGISPFVAYRINLDDKSKTLLEGFNFNLINFGKWSKSGKYFIFSVKGKSNLWLLKKDNSFIDLPLITSIDKVSWYFDEESGEDVLIYVEQPNENFYSLNTYFPSKNSSEKLMTFPVSDFSSSPTDLFVVGDGKSVYLKVDEENFRIILK